MPTAPMAFKKERRPTLSISIQHRSWSLRPALAVRLPPDVYLGLRRSWRAGLPVDDVVDRRIGTHVSQSVQLIRSIEDHRSRPGPLPLARSTPLPCPA